MDFKKLFRKDNKAVSPVIGVILMVAITVILAAAIGSSVFSHGTSKSAPQANLDIKPYGSYTTQNDTVLQIDHRGGDAINLNSASTKIRVMTKDGVTKDVTAVGSAGTTLNTGDTKTFIFKIDSTNNVQAISGDPINFKFIDVTSGQIYLDKNVTF